MNNNAHGEDKNNSKRATPSKQETSVEDEEGASLATGYKKRPNTGSGNNQ